MPGETQTPAPAVPRKARAVIPQSLPIALALVYLLVLFARGDVTDPDIWWHLRNASDLVRTHHFLHADHFTFTVAGQRWINIEWLAELPYYFAWRWLAAQGLFLVMVLAASAVALGVYALARLRSQDTFASLLAALVVIYFGTVSLAPRPLLFGWIFLVLELWLLEAFRQGRDHIAWLPLLFLLWINAHGSWFLGFGLLVLWFACGLAEGEWGQLYATRWAPAQRRRLLVAIAASFACLFVNPWGWRLVAYPLDALLHQKLGMQYIAEWASLDFHLPLGKAVLLLFLALAVLQLVRPRRWAAQDLACGIIALYGAVTYVRFVFLAGILVAPLLAAGLRLERSRERKRAGGGMLGIVATALLLILIALAWPKENRLEAGIAHSYPEKAVPYVRSLAGSGNVFDEYHWGGYLEWRAPQVQEFIDSRADIFVEHGIMADYARAVRIQEPFEVLDRYRIRYVLLPTDHPLAYLLAHSAAWKRSYDDGQTVVFQRLP